MDMDNNNQWLRVADVASISRATQDTVRYWIKQGRLPSVKPGRFRLVKRSDLDAFLHQNARGGQQ